MDASDEKAAEAEVLVFYALLMEGVQEFEWSLKTLTIQRDESMGGLSFDEAWRRAHKAMQTPIGPLKEQVPEGLAEEISELRVLRNRVAHEILLLWRLEIGLGRVDHATVAQGMFDTAEMFDNCRAKVDALAERHLRDLGIDPAELRLDENELKVIVEDLEDQP